MAWRAARLFTRDQLNWLVVRHPLDAGLRRAIAPSPAGIVCRSATMISNWRCRLTRSMLATQRSTSARCRAVGQLGFGTGSG